MGMNIAVTGISGYFGRALMPLLEADPDIESVIGIDHTPPLNGAAWSKLTYHALDMREPIIEQVISGVDVLLHMGFRMWRLPGDNDLDEINIHGSKHVFDTAVKLGIRKLIFTSSVVGYGLHPDNPTPLKETFSLRPNQDLYYSRAKGACEAYLTEIERQNPEMIITKLRPCAVAGPKAPRKQLEPYVASTAVVVRGYEPQAQLLHEDDLASALHLAIQEDLHGAYNVTSDEPRSFYQSVLSRNGRVIALPYSVMRLLMLILWRAGASLQAPEWIDLMRYPIVASNEKLKAAGWTPAFTTPETFKALLVAFGAE